MNLGELIKAFEQIKNKDRIVAKGFHNPHSWRGSYEELAVEPCEDVSIQSMLDCLKEALGKTYGGWKGGDFVMHEYVEVHISEQGQTYDYLWSYLIYYMTL